MQERRTKAEKGLKVSKRRVLFALKLTSVVDEGMSDEEDMAVDDEPSSNARETSTAISLPALVHPLRALIHPTPLSFIPLAGLPTIHPPTTSALGAIHLCALECLNNIFLSLSESPNASISSDIESGKILWDEIWSTLDAVGTTFGPGQERRRSIWDTATGVLWGIAKIWKGRWVSRRVRHFMLGCNRDLSSCRCRIRIK
jgi:hypothetical protein